MYKEEEILSPFLYTTHLYFLLIRSYSMFTLSFEKILPRFTALTLFLRRRLPVVISWHTLQIGLYIWSVGVSLTQRNDGPPKLTQLGALGEKCEQGIDEWAYTSQKDLIPWRGQLS